MLCELCRIFLKIGHREESVVESKVSRNILGVGKQTETMPSDFGAIISSCYHVMS